MSSTEPSEAADRRGCARTIGLVLTIGSVVIFATGYDHLTGSRAEGLERGLFAMWLLALVAICLPLCSAGILLMREGFPDRPSRPKH